MTPHNPWEQATAALEEFGRVMEGVARQAEVELEARGIQRDLRIPVLDQLAEVEGIWHSDVWWPR